MCLYQHIARGGVSKSACDSGYELRLFLNTTHTCDRKTGRSTTYTMSTCVCFILACIACHNMNTNSKPHLSNDLFSKAFLRLAESGPCCPYPRLRRRCRSARGNRLSFAGPAASDASQQAPSSPCRGMNMDELVVLPCVRKEG